MKDRISQAIDDIFKEYEHTSELQDLREEITANLDEHIRDMVQKGMLEEEALKKALAELGDITEAADEISRQKRKEVIGQAYAKSVPLDKIHAFGYPAAAVILAFGVIASAIVGFSSGGMVEIIGSLMPFAVAAVGGFVYLALTQETRTHYPMNWKRSAVYAASSMLLTFGFFVCALTLFVDITLEGFTGAIPSEAQFMFRNINMVSSLGVLIPFVLPALALLGFLLLTEKERKKPWLLHMEVKSQTVYGESFGLLSGALWVFAVGLFILLGIVVGWYLAWLVFIFAVAIQCLIQYFIIKKKHV